MKTIKGSLVWLLALGLLVLALGACNPVPCSTAYLVQAINNANASPATTDTIDLDPGCVYELNDIDNTVDGNNGLPDITSPIIINGYGATVRRGLNAQKQALRLFHVSPGGDLSLRDIILFDGLGMNPPDTTLPIVNNGGAIFNAGHVQIIGSTLDSNRAIVGGGIYNAASGVLSIDTSTLVNNQADINDTPLNRGGAIYNDGQASIFRSTLANNSAWSVAGGIDNEGTLSIINSTLSGNSTTVNSGLGSAIVGEGDLTIEYSTITENAGGASYAVFVNNIQSSVRITNSIIANNAFFDCFFSAPIQTGGANMDSDGTCPGFTLTGDPLLNPLLNNGGPTQTHALQNGSPAIDAALGSCPATDQRGEPRPDGPACDLGSYEGGTGPLATPAGVPTDTPTPVTPTATATPTDTPTPESAALVCTYTALENSNCRASDYAASDLVSILMQGEQADLVALNPEFTHGMFKLGSGAGCWIWLGLLDGPANPWGECGVPIVDPPQPTATPTSACNRELDPRACLAAGGEWVNESSYCSCP